MKLLKRITNKDITGTDDVTLVEPEKAVRVVLLDDNNMAAVMYIAKWNFYMLPGGRMEEGELVEQALERETMEETGCKLEIIHELGIIEENRAVDDYILLSFCFLARVLGEKGALNLTQEEMDTDTQVQWHSLHNAYDLIKNQSATTNVMKFIRERELILLSEAMKHMAGN